MTLKDRCTHRCPGAIPMVIAILLLVAIWSVHQWQTVARGGEPVRPRQVAKQPDELDAANGATFALEYSTDLARWRMNYYTPKHIDLAEKPPEDGWQLPPPRGRQRLYGAWTVGDKKTPVYEAGLSNLTKDQTTILVHRDGGKVEQMLLVRVQDDRAGLDGGAAASAAAAKPSPGDIKVNAEGDVIGGDEP